MGYAWVPDLNGASPAEPLPPGVGAVPLNINGGSRIGPGGAYLQPALERAESDAVGRHPRRPHPIRQGARGRRGLCRPGWARRLDRRADCAVRRGNRIGAPPAAVRYRSRGYACGRGHSRVVDSPVGVRTSDHPEWVLPVDWTPTHDLPPLEAILTTPMASRSGRTQGLRRDGGGRRRRSRRPAAHRRFADAAQVQGQSDGWCPAIPGCPDHRASLRQ